jgi:hypothetical protein
MTIETVACVDLGLAIARKVVEEDLSCESV